MRTFVRLYGTPECPHCQKAALFLQAHGIHPDLIDIANDPVATAGVMKYAVKEGQLETPVLVSPTTKQVIRGFDEADYRGLVDALRRTSTPDVSGNGEHAAAPTAQKGEVR